jgi:hypothetical protein
MKHDMMPVDSQFTNRFISTSKKRQMVYSMVILGLLLIFATEYELHTHDDERIGITWDGPFGGGYDEIIVGLPNWVYPMRFAGLIICVIGFLAGITLLDSKRIN